MDNVLDDLVRAAERCERATKLLEADKILAMRKRLTQAIAGVERAWSGSWIGYHSRIYTHDLQPRRPGESFDSEWGMGGRFATTTAGEWAEYDHDDVVEHVNHVAGTSDEDWGQLEAAAATAASTFEAVKSDVLPTLDAVLAAHNDTSIRKVRESIEALTSHHSRHEFVLAIAPRQWTSRDSRAMNEGRQVAPHLQVQVRLAEQFSYGTQLAQLGKHIRHVATYLGKVHKMKGASVARTDGKIFIGHGGSATWRELKDFLQDRLRLEWDEFNREAAAGKSTKERLSEMLDACFFAFLVMTAEDETAAGKFQARANVIHELGLFQGRLGFERAVVLLEEGCEEFSNIVGLTQIRFPRGRISASFEEIRRVLEREGIHRT